MGERRHCILEKGTDIVYALPIYIEANIESNLLLAI